MVYFALGRWISRVLKVLCQALLVSIAVVIFMQVILRFFFGFAFPWVEEYARYALIWLVLLGLPYLVRIDDHLRLPALSDHLPRVPRLLMTAAIQAIVAVIGGMLAYIGWLRATDMAFTRAVGLDVSMFWPLLAVPVGGALVCLFSTGQLVMSIASLATGRDIVDQDALTEQKQVALGADTVGDK